MRLAYSLPFHVFLSVHLAVAQTLSGAAPGQPKATSENETRPAAADRLTRLTRLLDAIAALEKDIPRETFDPAAVVRKLGPEPGPDKLFAFVRDGTYLVPYRGALRGSRGVLMDRLGNSLDRALLLGELLRLTGRKVRLANATLSEEKAAEILAAARKAPQDGVQSDPAAARKQLNDLLIRHAKEAGMDADALRLAHTKRQAQTKEIANQASARAAEQTAALAKAVAPARDKTAPANGVQAVRDHWWIQYHDGKNWIDLDPTLPNAEAGQSLTAPDRTVEVKANASVEESLPAEHYHKLIVRVVIEQWTQGKLTEHVPLACTLTPAWVIDSPIVLQQIPTKWPKDVKVSKGANAMAAMQQALAQQSKWRPVLFVGQRSFPGKSYNADGYVGEEPKPKSGFVLISDRLREESRPTGHLTAEWIEYEIAAPGGKTRKIRREVFDLLGPSQRQAKREPAGPGAPMGEPKFSPEQLLSRAAALTDAIEILPLVCRLTPAFVEHLTARSVRINRAALEAIARASATGETPKLDKPMVPIPRGAYALASARQQWNPQRGSLYLDSVNVLTHHRGLVLTDPPKAGRLSFCQGFDMVTNDVAAHAEAGVDAFSARLAQGVLDTNAEAMLISSCRPVSSTAILFDLSRKQDVAWVLLHKGDDLSKLEVPKDAKARIAAALADGDLVVAPTKATELAGRPAVAWWQVNPKTGQAKGITARGWGGDEMSEWTILQMRAEAMKTMPVAYEESMFSYFLVFGSLLLCGVAVYMDIPWYSDLMAGICIGVDESLPEASSGEPEDIIGQ